MSCRNITYWVKLIDTQKSNKLIHFDYKTKYKYNPKSNI